MAALICFGVPLALLLLSAGVADAVVPDHPEFALLGLLSLPGVAIGVRRCGALQLAQDAEFVAQEPPAVLIVQTRTQTNQRS